MVVSRRNSKPPASGPGGGRVGEWHQRIINQLYATDRLQRLIDAEAAYGTAVYGFEEFFGDMEKGIWAELDNNNPTTVYRRNLQKMHLEKLIELTKPANASSGTISTFVRTTGSVNPVMSDIRSISIGRLAELHKKLKKAERRSGDSMSQYHYLDCMKRIEEVLESR